MSLSAMLKAGISSIFRSRGDVSANWSTLTMFVFTIFDILLLRSRRKEALLFK